MTFEDSGMRRHPSIIRRVALLASAFIISPLCLMNSANSAEEEVYRTGVHALPRYFSVAPDGKYLIFDTKKPLRGMRLLNLRTRELGDVPAESERHWEMGNLSRDGKRMVAVSTGMKNGKYNLSDMKIILVDLKDWSWQEVSRTGDGVKITPFFSPDGKKVYYFKGEARTEGATPAAKYDLYVIDISAQKEEKLTDARFYQVTAGDVSPDSRTVLFGRIGGAVHGAAANSIAGPHGRDSGIMAFDMHTKRLQPTSYLDDVQLVAIDDPRLDRRGRMYFGGITQAERGRYIFSLFRYDEGVKTAQRLTDFSNWSRFDIAKQSGDIYVSDTRDGEIVFRRLAINANQ